MAAVQDGAESCSFVHRVIQEGASEYVVYAECGEPAASGLAQVITVGITNGMSILSCELECGDLETNTTTSGSRDTATLFNSIRAAVEKGSMELNYTDRCMSVTVPGSGKVIDLQLQSVPGEQEREQLKTLLFRLAKQPATKKQPQFGNHPEADRKERSIDFYCFGLSAKGTLQNKPKRGPGMSMVNPGSKKIKAAKGIQFEDN